MFSVKSMILEETLSPSLVFLFPFEGVGGVSKESPFFILNVMGPCGC